MPVTSNQFILANDTISGKEGYASMIDSTGRYVQLFRAEKVSAKANLKSAKINPAGCRVTQTKNTGVEYTGTMSIYYGSPYFMELVNAYANTGVMPTFDLFITNNDPASGSGLHEEQLSGCKIEGDIDLAKIDGASEVMMTDVAFSATGRTTLTAFNDDSTLNVGTQSSIPSSGSYTDPQ